MRQLLSILIFISLTQVIRGQTYNIFSVTSKADKIFTDTVGDNFKAIKAKAFEIRTTDKKETYDYYTVTRKKTVLIPNSI